MASARDAKGLSGHDSDTDVIPEESYICEDEADCVIIHEVFDEATPPERGERELDKAMEQQHSTIVIEPHELGEETVRWIRVGNALHKSCVVSGLAALGVGAVRPSWAAPFGVISVCCAATYSCSWQYDPACKYQVDTKGNYLHRIPLDQLSSAAPIVLIRRDDTVRKKLHNTVATAASLFLIFHLVKWVRQ